MGDLHSLYDRHRDEIDFVVVYIKEAHPEDGWVLDRNRRAGIAVEDPTSDEERLAVASSCALAMKLRMPVVVDGLDNEVARVYGGWPDRLYLVGRDGGIAFQGGPGPFEFRPQELAAAIERELADLPAAA